MNLTRVIITATRIAAPSTPAITTWTGLMVTMSCSPAAFLRTPKKLQNTATMTRRKLAGFGCGSRGGSLGRGSFATGLGHRRSVRRRDRLSRLHLGGYGLDRQREL